MPQPAVPNRVCAMRGYNRLRRYADLSACLAYAAELSGDGKEAARHQLSAMLLDARADRLTRTEGRRA